MNFRKTDFLTSRKLNSQIYNIRKFTHAHNTYLTKMSRSMDSDKTFLGRLNAAWKDAKDYEKECKGDPEALAEAKKASAFASKNLRKVQEIFLGMNPAEKAEFIALQRAEHNKKLEEEITKVEYKLSNVKLIIHRGSLADKHTLNVLQARLKKLQAQVA